jgi:glycosyltransferase involved in cell wall biosynthesis
MRRILYFCDSKAWGGAEIYLLRLTEGLAGRGLDLHVAVPKGDASDEFESLLASNVALHIYESKGKIPPILQTRDMIREVRPDLVHFMLTSFRSCRYSIWLCRWLCRLPIVLTIQLLNPLAAKKGVRPGAIAAFMTRKAIEGARAVIVVSHGTRDLLIDRFRVRPSPNLQVIHNAIDNRFHCSERSARDLERSRWGLSPADFIIIMVARLEDEAKAQSAALEALRIIMARIPRPVLVFVGDGSSRAMLEARARQLDLQDRVVFTGRLPAVERLLNMADLAILPSRREGLPFALLEAMACGLPVVASKVGGVPELVEDGTTGYLIDPADVDQLAERISLLYHDRMLRDRLGLAAQMVVREKFSLDAMVEKTLKAYEPG